MIDEIKINSVRFIDLFCGIGGIRLAAEGALRRLNIRSACVFSSDIDIDAQHAYQANFGERPRGDITAIHETEIPDHDLLLAGFPCQPFSIIGGMKGFEDTRGTLFFDISRILKLKRPKVFVLENVKMLRGHDGGRTLEHILRVLRELDYTVDYRVLNALDFGLPQKRERIFIVGIHNSTTTSSPLVWPAGADVNVPLAALLTPHNQVPLSYFASARIRHRRLLQIASKVPESPTIWHENKAGHISAYPFSCAQRAGASYNYLLVDGKRRLTEREMLALNGFPESYKIVCNYQATRKQAGNSVAVPCVEAVIRAALKATFSLTEPTPQSVATMHENASDYAYRWHNQLTVEQRAPSLANKNELALL